MRTGFAVWTSIFIAIFILSTGAIAFIVYAEVQQRTADDIPNPLMNAEFVIQDITDENDGISGQWGYIEISSAELTITPGQLKEFAENYVKDSSLLWVSIMTPDGAGFYFPEANYEYAEYGALTADGRTATLYTTFTLRDGSYEYQNVGGSGTPVLNEPAGDDYYKGKVIDRTTYENDWLGIRFTAPEGYVMLTDEEIEPGKAFTEEIMLENLDQINKGDILNAELEMICGALAQPHNVIVAAEVIDDPSITVEQHIESYKALMQEIAAVKWIINDGMEKVTVAGLEFTKIHGSITIEDITQYQNIYFIKKENILFNISVTYTETSAADALINAFQAK